MKQYKHLLLTLICTLGVLWLFKGAFLTQALTVSATIDAEKSFQAQVFYEEKKGDGFHEKRSIRQQVQSGKSVTEIKLPIDHISGFRFDIGFQPGKVTLSDFKVIGAKTEKLDYNSFSPHQIDSFEVQGNKLHLTSNQGDPYIVYKKDMKVTHGYQVDWCILLILFCACWFVFSKGISYSAKFKVLEQHSRIDILFLMMFFGLLFIPMLHISDAERSEQEKRTLATKPHLMRDGKINNDFGTKFNDWFNDRFFGRNFVLNLDHALKYMVAPSLGSNKVLVGKDGWLFFKQNNGLENYANLPDIPEEKLKHGLTYLKDINDWCKKHHKKFYYIIIPDKHRIYGENYRLVNKQRSDEYGIAKQFVKYIQQNSDVNVMYLQDDLLKHKDKGLLYFKEGTHWSDLGAYYAYQSIMDHISKDFSLPRVAIDRWQDVEASDPDLLRTYTAGKLLSYGKIYKAPLYQKKANCTQQTKYEREHDGEVICHNVSNKYRAFIIRDSFFSWLISYVSDTFKDIKLLWKIKYDLSQEDLNDIDKNYDIVIIENVERFLPYVLKTTFPKEN